MHKVDENTNIRRTEEVGKPRHFGGDMNSKQHKIKSPFTSKNSLQVRTPLKVNVNTTEMNACFTPTTLFRKVTQSPVIKDHIRKSKLVKSSHIECVEDRLVVAVRIRPMTEEERKTCINNIIKATDKEIKVLNAVSGYESEVIHTFQYDYVFDSSVLNGTSERVATQETVYLKIGNPLIERALEGYNACVFAYGQTGSGKSFSMMGVNAPDSVTFTESHREILNLEAGIIPRFCYELFQYINKNNICAEVEVSFCEIYNEKIYDLLYASNSSKDEKQKRVGLKAREHPVWGPYVVGLNVHPVSTYEALKNWLTVGNSRRATVLTRHNDKSSRSHSILNIIITKKIIDEMQSGIAIRRSKISLVDLAGSERISGTDAERMREGVCINKSLLTLGKVISCLADGKSNISGGTFIPYRESTLTWLLRENLGGNSKTIMLATISPASIHVEETLATLRYACQARNIINKVKINESEQEKIIRELRFEIEKLKVLHQQSVSKVLPDINNPSITIDKIKNEIESLREQLHERELELALSQKSWSERLKDAENIREAELRLLKRKGLAFEITNEQNQAYLVNLSEDPMLSGILFYILPSGCVKIGRTRSDLHSSRPDIMLDGPLIGHNHCIIENINGTIHLIPESKDFDTYINGEIVHDKTEIYNGDRLIFGGSHYFRILKHGCNQKEPKKVITDFQLAYNEVLQKQEQALRLELEKEMCDVLIKIENERSKQERDLKERIEELEMERITLRCHTEIDESEKKLVTTVSPIKEIEKISDVGLSTTSKASFMENIKNIMKGPCQGENLHKTQLMVKEASQYANDHELNYEFKYTHLMDEFGMFQPKVLVIDKKLNRMARWPVGRLEVWLEIMRNNMDPQNNTPFSYVDVEWEPIKMRVRKKLHEALNSSSISLNCSITNEETHETAPMTLLPHNKEKQLSTLGALSATCLEKIRYNIRELRELCQKHLDNNDNGTNDHFMEPINKLESALNDVNCHISDHVSRLSIVGKNYS